jgi:hypothetical protein
MMKKALLALAVAGAAVSVQADVSISGHVNYAAGNIEDFVKAQTGSVAGGDLEDQDDFDARKAARKDFSVYNNSASGSRFRIVASKEANGITYATRQEFSVNGSSAPGGRVSDITMAGDFGKVYLGHGWESGEDATENDYSGTYVLTGSGTEAFGDTQVANIDGGRDQRLRYDTPKIGGLAVISIDKDNSDDLGVALSLKGSMWKAGIYSEQKDVEGADELGGSVAVKVSGFTAALQVSSKESGTSDIDYTNVILGYNVGKISFAVDMSSRETTAAGGATTDENSTQGLSFIYRPTGGVELYAGARTAEADNGDLDYQAGLSDDASGFIVGARVKF